MILMGSVINAGTRTIYLDASQWHPSDATFAIHVWGGASAQSYAFSNVSGDLYSAEIADDATNAIFLRCNPSNFDISNVWNFEWNRSTTTLSAKDLYKVTSWSSGSSDSAEHGEWSTSGSSEPEESFTFPAGTEIYYDFRGYGKGVNLYNSVWNNEWKDNDAVDVLISCTLTSDWTVTANSTLFRSDASGWGNVKCTTLPTDGQNMLISTDGATYTWKYCYGF